MPKRLKAPHSRCQGKATAAEGRVLRLIPAETIIGYYFRRVPFPTISSIPAEQRPHTDGRNDAPGTGSGEVEAPDDLEQRAHVDHEKAGQPRVSP
jgi:hypothetical protein